MLDSKALTKIQSIILVAVIVLAAVGGGLAYILLSGEEPTSDPIKIGVCVDLDGLWGNIWKGAVLAAEQVNSEGGVLGRNFTIVAQDDDSYTAPFDSNIAVSAMTKLITVDKADFIIASAVLPSSTIYQEIAAEHKKILFLVGTAEEELTQHVLDNYSRYKYFFRTGLGNETAMHMGIADSLALCREFTGFNKVAFIYQAGFSAMVPSIIDAVDDYGFEVVYDESLSGQVLDYSSYFARAEAAGAEILYPMILGLGGMDFIKEYYNRQSPMVMWGVCYGDWEESGGKCEYTTSQGSPVDVGYPLTSKVLPTREAYFERWGEEIEGFVVAAYDTVRFILPDAIERAGTIETEAVIKALEETDVETCLARRFVFTSSHDIMVGEADSNRPTEDYFLMAMFQWQDGVQVPVYPIELMEEAGTSYTFPDWSGPWDDLD